MNNFSPKIFFQNQKGILLISSYMALSSLMVLSLALWTQGTAHMRGAEDSLYQMEAFHLAESALDVAISNLEADIDYEGSGSVNYTKNGSLVGRYEATVTTPDGDNPMLKLITATGTTPNLGNGRGQMTRTIVSYVRLRPRQTFDFAIFTDKGMSFNGSPSQVVDSYDSSRGNYSSFTATSTAEVVTNATQNSSVELIGNVTIKGNVNVGPGANLASAISVGSNSTITGTTGSQISTREYEPSEVPSSAVPLGSVSVTSDYYMQPGTYVMDSLSVTGNGAVQASGPVEIYITGNASIGGNGVITASDKPKNMIIHMVGSGTMTYSGNGSLFGAVYAPLADVRVTGNGSIYGAVIADSYTQSGRGDLHFDEDLKNPNTEVRLRSEIVSWREMNKYLG